MSKTFLSLFTVAALGVLASHTWAMDPQEGEAQVVTPSAPAQGHKPYKLSENARKILELHQICAHLFPEDAPKDLPKALHRIALLDLNIKFVDEAICMNVFKNLVEKSGYPDTFTLSQTVFEEEVQKVLDETPLIYSALQCERPVPFALVPTCPDCEGKGEEKGEQTH